VRGARWQYVGTSAGGDPVVYVDANARHDHRRFRTAWRRDEHPGGSAHVSVEIVDCARHRSRTAKVTAYRADGTVLTRDHFNESEAPFFEPTPGSVGAAFVDVVCGRG
jgi:hypothetical protein